MPECLLDYSVVIPSFNRLHTLTEALDSVHAQSLPPREVIVVDDGSTDGTEECLALDYPAVQVVRQQNQGVSAARNRGIAMARGEWIALLDSDDHWLPAKMQRQAEALAENPGHRLCHCDEIWMRDGRRVNPMDKHAKARGWCFSTCLPRCAISPSAAVVHTSVFRDLGGFDESLPACEDYDLWLRLCAKEPVWLVEQALVVKTGGHADQLSRRYWGMDRFRIQALEGVIERGIPDHGDWCQAIAMLVEKIRVYTAGAEKRGRLEEAREYRRRADRYLSQISMPGSGLG